MPALYRRLRKLDIGQAQPTDARRVHHSGWRILLQCCGVLESCRGPVHTLWRNVGAAGRM